MKRFKLKTLLLMMLMCIGATQTIGAYTHVITFDANGGTNQGFGTSTDANTWCGMNADGTGYVGVTTNEGYYWSVSNLPTRTGYTFNGWWTAKDGGTQVYDASGSSVTGTYWNGHLWIGTSNLTVYAHWTEITVGTATFHHVDIKALNHSGNYNTQTFEGLANTSTSITYGDWYCHGGSRTDAYNSVALQTTSSTNTSPWQICIQRYDNVNAACENFDWFYIDYSAPSYSKVTYQMGVGIHVYHSGYAEVRGAYFDYGTDPNGYWSARNAGPNGETSFWTANIAVSKGGAWGTSTSNALLAGETLAMYEFQTYEDKWSDKWEYNTFDNGSSATPSIFKRYGGFSSSKTVNTYDFYTNMQWWIQNATITYCNVITFDANGGEGTMDTKTIGNGEALPVNAFTRKNYIFAGWSTTKGGTKLYGDKGTLSVTSTSKGPLTLYAIWDEAGAEVTYGTTTVYKYNLGEAITWANTNATADCNIKVLKDNSYTASSKITWSNAHNFNIDLGAEGVTSTISGQGSACEYGNGKPTVFDIYSGANTIGGYGTLKMYDSTTSGTTDINKIVVSAKSDNQTVSLTFNDRAKYDFTTQYGRQRSIISHNIKSGGNVNVIINGGVFTSTGVQVSQLVTIGNNGNAYVHGGEFHWKASDTSWAGCFDYASTGEFYIYDGYIDGHVWYSKATSKYLLYGGKYTADSKVYYEMNSNKGSYTLSQYISVASYTDKLTRTVHNISETKDGVTYSEELAGNITLDETTNNTSEITKYGTSQSVYATINGTTLSKDHLNAVCLPFAMTAEDITKYFGADCVVKEITNAEMINSQVLFTYNTVTAMEAGKPYLVQPAADVALPMTIASRHCAAQSPVTETYNNINVTGVYNYNASQFSAADYGKYFVATNGVLLNPTAATQNGLSFYVQTPVTTAKNFSDKATWEAEKASNPNAVAVANSTADIPEGVSTDNWFVKQEDGDTYETTNLVVTDGKAFTMPTVDGKTFKAATATYTRDTKRNWGTICLPYAVSTDDYVQYYELSKVDTDKGVMSFTAVDNVDANTPAVFCKKQSADAITPTNTDVPIVTTGEETSEKGSWKLIGTLSGDKIQNTESSKYYIAQDKFWNAQQASGEITIPAYRAYFQYTGNGAKVSSFTIAISDGDSTTAIGTIDANGDIQITGVYPELSRRGKYMQDGKVVIVNDGKKYNTAGQNIK